MLLERELQTEVFINEGGKISILQDGDIGSDDVIVVLSAERARLVAAALIELAEEICLNKQDGVDE
jgi:hypothetical protein